MLFGRYFGAVEYCGWSTLQYTAHRSAPVHQLCVCRGKVKKKGEWEDRERVRRERGDSEK